ncbi:hypothetical protein [Streptomyces shenzhenensis]|uniref:hypothetical protein n=1 Tax=Streptomyces shenzhenensis TaxID=943815 RepID=UPI001F1E8685|nr:hypothetical protein [Streptomyces shenzhenensis]
MQKLKKAAAVAVMVGGIGLAGGGIANAAGCDDPSPEVAVNNLQVADCRQSFDGGLAFAPSNVADIGGGLNQNIGNFCANVNAER